jgi:amino-acid N-acetyltransferase
MHRGKTFVVGIAGEAIAAGKLHHLAQDLALIQSMGVRSCWCTASGRR